MLQAHSQDPAATADDAFALTHLHRPVLIAAPLYRHPELAESLVASLIDCAADIAAIGGEVVLYNDSPQDADLTQALETIVARAGAAFSCRLERNAVNLGFVRTANRALEEATARGMDALLLNSDTVVFPGALAEMVRVSRLDPMTGFVNPRSNNASLATLPHQPRFAQSQPREAYQAWAALAGRLPEVSYVPTGIGFCLLVRWAVLKAFGGFDEIYGAGYNEENDLIMRAGRRGFRAVLANRAFVWHKGSASFGAGGQSALEQANRSILLARYPEYDPLVRSYFESPEYRAECLLGALLPGEDGRLEVGFDFSSFLPAHNGTFAAGAQLVAAAATDWADRFKVFVLCSKEVYAFHGYKQLGVERRDPHDPRPMAAIFRVGQPFEWGALERLAFKAATFGVFMLDTIAIDCSNLATPRTLHLWAYALEHADFIATTSEMTSAQLERRFAFGPQALRVRSLHSLDLDDYRLPQAPRDAAPWRPGFIFVIGNHYWHKDAAGVANELATAFPERDIVVMSKAQSAGALGAERAVDTGRHAPRGLARAPNIVRLSAGDLPETQMGALYAHAAAIVFPSYYEGFGIPVLNALAARRPVLVRPLPVFEEMSRALGGEPNLHVFSTTEDLIERLRSPPEWIAEGASGGRPGDAARAAQDIRTGIEAALERADYSRMVRRLRFIQSAHDMANALVGSGQAPAGGAAPETPEAFVAERIGVIAAQMSARVLSLPGAFEILRACVKLMRSLRGGRRSAA